MHIRFFAILFALAACTPKLQGSCGSDGDCRAGETCAAGGFCVPADGTTLHAGVEMLSPANGSFAARAFHVSAQVVGLTPDDVTFAVTAADTGAALGSRVVTTAAGGVYSDTVTLDATSFGGLANVRAIAHVAGSSIESAQVLLHIDQAAPAIATLFDGSRWFPRDASIDVVATITDDNDVGAAQLVLADGGSYDGARSASTFTFHLPAADVAPAGGEAAVPFSLTATDIAGNHAALADAGTLRVDDAPPAVSQASIDTAADALDGAGQGWFLGPTAAPDAADIAVSAVISDGFLDETSVAAVVGGQRFAGTPAGGRWAFSLPRSIGLNASGPVIVSFDARDQAGHHPASPPELTLQFDDVSASAFQPVVAADANWYARDATVRPAVSVSLPAVPRSGVRSVLMKVAGQADVACAGEGPSWSCVLPSTYAPAGAETVLGVSVTAASFAGLASAGSGSRNVDDAPPVISASAPVPYPSSAAGTPLGWSHDGSHFNLRDSAVLYTFSAYDCGAGSLSVQSFSVSPTLSTRGTQVTDSGARQACSNGIAATVFNVSVTGDLSSAAAAAFAGADNTFSVTAAVQDGAKDAQGGLAAHSSSATRASINATRRIWQTPASAATQVAVGAAVVISGPTLLGGLRIADGGSLWSTAAAVSSGPAIAGSQGFFGRASRTAENAIVPFDVLTGVAGTACTVTGTPSLPAGCKTPSFLDRANQLALLGNGAAILFGTVTNTGQNTTTGDPCGSELSTVGELGAACTLPGTSVAAAIDNLQVGRGRAFFVSQVDNVAAGTSTAPTVGEAPVSGGGVVTSGVSCDSLLVTDNGGSDSPVCDGARYTWNGAGFAGPSYVSASPSLTLPGRDLYFAGANGFALSSGGALFSGTGTVLALDASPTPVAYVASGAQVSALLLNGSGGGFGAAAWGMPALPGTGVADLAVDKRGNAYVVSSNGQVSAIATDSPGLGIANNGWATRARDACRSASLDFTCPF